jgi:hypothetical protein
VQREAVAHGLAKSHGDAPQVTPTTSPRALISSVVLSDWEPARQIERRELAVPESETTG